MIKKTLLPKEYQQVEYIDTRGSGQYIDTGVSANNDKLSFAIKYKFNALTSGAYQYIIGAYNITVDTSENYNTVRILQYGADKTYLNVNTKASGGTSTYNYTRDTNTIYEETLSNTKFTSNGNTLDITNTTKGTTYNNNILLFKSYPTAGSAYANIRLYYCKIYDNGTLIRHFIPCYRKSDNVIGLYDAVTKTFFTNQGSSTFYKGNDVLDQKEVGFIYKNNESIDEIYKGTTLVFEQGFMREDSGVLPLSTTHKAIGKNLKDYKVYGESEQKNIPNEYQQVEYLQSTGTQYINTDYSPNQNSKMWLDYQPTEAQSTMYAGARNTSASAWQNRAYFTINSGNANTLMYGAFGNSGNVELGSMTTNRVQTQIGIDGIYYNGSKKYTPSSSSSFTLTEKVLLFGVMQNGTTVSASLLSKAKIYACKIWENDVLVRDFIPCYRKSDNVAGMYDKVNNIFYINEGTGTFTYGEAIYPIPTPTNPIEIKSVGDKTNNLFGGTYNQMYKLETPIPANTSIKFSGDNVSSQCYVAIYDKDSVEITNSRLSSTQSGRRVVTLTPTEDVYYVKFYNVELTNYSIRLDNLVDYEPYGYRIPINISGKNLMNYNLSRTVTDINLNGSISSVNVNIPSGKTITVSADVDATDAGGDINGVSLVLTYDDDTTYTYYYWNAGCIKILQGEKGRSYTSVVASKDVKMVALTGHAFNATNGGTTIFSNFQVEVGNTVDYEPYFEPVTTNIYLENPLRKVGDYADYIDFKNQKVIRKIASFMFASSNNWAVYRTNADNTVYNLDNTLTPLIGSPLLAPMCSHFKQVSTGGTVDFNAGEMRFQMTGSNIGGTRIYVGASQMTLDAFKTWVSSNNPELIYTLETPTEENVTLPTIPSFKGTTIYSIDTEVLPSSMYVKYKGR